MVPRTTGHTFPGNYQRGVEVIDYYHAADHLKKAFDQAYGENSIKSKEKFVTYRHVLKEELDGVERIIKALAYQHKKHPRRSKIKDRAGVFQKKSPAYALC